MKSKKFNSGLILICNKKKLDKEIKRYNFRRNIHLIENVKLFSNENKILYEVLIKQSNNFQEFDMSKFNLDKNLIDRVFKYASIKNILEKSSNDEEKIENILNNKI